jgi:hypothetical protein
MVMVPPGRVRTDVERLATRGLGITEFFAEAGRVLRRAMRFEGFCSMTVDPATMMLTSHIAHGSVRPEDVPLLGRNEFLEDDVNKFAVLAGRPKPSGVLTDATGGDPSRSRRFETILVPNGISDELRFALLDENDCWGWVALYRRGGGQFQPPERDFAAAVSRPLAEGLRRAILLANTVTAEAPGAPGMLVLGPDGKVETGTANAERLLSSVIAAETGPGGLPAVVHAVAYRALLSARGEATSGSRARVPTGDGSWLVLHGSVLGDPEEGRTGVIIEPARAPEVAPVIVAAYGLTPRERDVAQQILLGGSSAEIAELLGITAYTVQDHLKSIFDKVGVPAVGSWWPRSSSRTTCRA